jgi:hypothetical protein
MKLGVLALSLATLCIPSVTMAQTGTTTTTPSPDAATPPTADCSTLSGSAAADCNAQRNQQDQLDNGSGTGGALQTPSTSSHGTTGGSGTLTPTIPDSTLGGGGSNNNTGTGLGGSSSGGGM